MVELNNKLKLPIYTRFEHKFLNKFDSSNVCEISSNFGEILSEQFQSSLNMEVKQINNHLQNLNDAKVINLSENYEEMVRVYINGNENFRQSLQLNIKKNTENKVIIECDINCNNSSLSIDINAEENSLSEIVIITKGNSNNSNFIKVNVHRDSTCNVYFINSAKNDLNDVSVSLLGENSSSKLKTVAIAKDAKKYFSLRIDHFAKNSYGRLVNHGVGLDNSTLVIDGFGKIHKDCKQSDNYQKSKVLSLSDTSHVEANPILLIDEYDVWASHAASISNVDPSQLYYLKSRGMNQNQAEVLLIKGFLKSIVNEIDNEEIANIFENILDEKIGFTDEF